jgi:acetylornithine deacetylase/succinyl-diaminopimelate desuccinylase-like protein
MEKRIAQSFSGQRAEWYQKACSRIDAQRLQRLLFELVDIHSPTGAASPASTFMAQRLAAAGLESRYQPMTQKSGNVLAEYRGSGKGRGATLMLYAPIDTHLECDDAERLWTGNADKVDMQPRAKLNGDWVYGLGASNPKSMVATLTEVATALIEAEVPIVGDLLVGFADGGMPVDISARDHAGMSNGVLHMLNRGAAADFAVLMKPWNWVYHEEPGMAWFKLRVHGTLGYAGVPRGAPGFRSSVVPAARVIEALEAWILEYVERNTSGVIAPYGWISGARSGDPERPAFPSAITEIFLDIRINPRSTPAAVKAEFGRFVEGLKARDPSLVLDWDMYGSVPGGTTDEQNWIVQSAFRAWEHIEQRPHGKPDLLGGQTDGAALRRYGVPTVRIGWPWPADGSPEPVAEGLGGMGATYVPDLIPCAQKIMYIVIDTLTRERSELGL